MVVLRRRWLRRRRLEVCHRSLSCGSVLLLLAISGDRGWLADANSSMMCVCVCMDKRWKLTCKTKDELISPHGRRMIDDHGPNTRDAVFAEALPSKISSNSKSRAGLATIVMEYGEHWPVGLVDSYTIHNQNFFHPRRWKFGNIYYIYIDKAVDTSQRIAMHVPVWSRKTVPLSKGITSRGR